MNQRARKTWVSIVIAALIIAGLVVVGFVGGTYVFLRSHLHGEDLDPDARARAARGDACALWWCDTAHRDWRPTDSPSCTGIRRGSSAGERASRRPVRRRAPVISLESICPGGSCRCRFRGRADSTRQPRLLGGRRRRAAAVDARGSRAARTRSRPRRQSARQSRAGVDGVAPAACPATARPGFRFSSPPSSSSAYWRWRGRWDGVLHLPARQAEFINDQTAEQEFVSARGRFGGQQALDRNQARRRTRRASWIDRISRSRTRTSSRRCAVLAYDDTRRKARSRVHPLLAASDAADARPVVSERRGHRCGHRQRSRAPDRRRSRSSGTRIAARSQGPTRLASARLD